MLANKKSIYYLRLFLDLFIINLSFLASAVFAQSWEILLERNYMFILMAGLNFSWYLFSDVINFYDDFNTKHFSYQLLNVLKLAALQVIVSILFIFAAKELLFTRNFILYNSLIVISVISIRIILLRVILGSLMRKEKNQKNLLIVGAGETGRSIKELIVKHPEFGLRFSGYVDIEKDSVLIDDYLGTTEELDRIITQIKIDTVVIALSLVDPLLLDNIIRVCNKHAVRTHIIPDYFKFLSKKYQVNLIGDFPVITVRAEPLSEIHWRFLKRIFDINFSLLVFALVLWWLIPVIYLLNLINSRGKLFFIQERTGAHGKTFNCYKFRTMHESKQTDTFVPVVQDDPRITELGKILRRTNLDELPQFINVFKGDMSVVGPRPHMISFQKIYEQMVEEIKIRSWVKPGITGWAQIHGLRGDVPDFEENKKRMKKRIDYDLWYIENWSPWLDIQIILLTGWQMVKGDTKGI
ncbi:MAG: exopolysaccharide biosynthesis polyprenyl glycosylphosphotransferase [Ignavibacteriales bacterium]|nr:MAG: exopolysaccharide biosynthesis polyprenyl glycosylphosphotransferase [Ignavibacteriales bacterium]